MALVFVRALALVLVAYCCICRCWSCCPWSLDSSAFSAAVTGVGRALICAFIDWRRCSAVLYCWSSWVNSCCCWVCAYWPRYARNALARA